RPRRQRTAPDHRRLAAQTRRDRVTAARRTNALQTVRDGALPVAVAAAGADAGSDVSLLSLLTSPVSSMNPHSRHIVAFVITSPVCIVRNRESWGRNEVRTGE